jgi:hypothetical protein
MVSFSEVFRQTRDRLRLLTTSDRQPQKVMTKICSITSIAEDRTDVYANRDCVLCFSGGAREGRGRLSLLTTLDSSPQNVIANKAFLYHEYYRISDRPGYSDWGFL